MYTLLIVDDEEYTREGIIADIPLKELGINRVIQADNGVNALKKIETCQPDIVVTDIRMPRMDGIEMVQEIRKKYANTIIIFISGYSDTIYLKSAITFQAIKYVDKPIDVKELTMALIESIKLCDERRKTLVSKERELTLNLIYPQKNDNIISRLVESIGVNELQNANCLTFIIKLFYENDEDSFGISLIQENILEIVNEHIHNYPLALLCTYKNDDCLVCHLIEKRRNTLSHTYLNRILKELSAQLSIYQHQIAVGNLANGIRILHASYTSAVLSLQSNFFIGINSISYSCDNHNSEYIFNPQLIDRMADLLLAKDWESSNALIKEITHIYSENTCTLINNVKDAYYRLITKILQISEQKNSTALLNIQDERFIWDIISKITSLQELESITIDCLNSYFKATIENMNSKSLVTDIKNVINSNISNPNLCIDMISATLYLTSTYLCYIFKQETGRTINQYITCERLEIARTHLQNGRLKVSEVASKIGMDNNYFSKLFKKHTGLSPSEYREGHVL